MILVRKIPHQYNPQSFKLEKYTTDMYFNPQLDADGNWFISEEEFEQIDQSIKDKYAFIANLEQIEYNPVILPDPLGVPIGI